MSMHRTLLHILSILVILTLLFSPASLPTASAQGADGIQRQVNTQTGKLSFLGPEDGRTLSAARALGTSARPQDPAMALVKRFGPEFGVRDPERTMRVMTSDQSDDGRITVRYQQNYEGIPVMGGELIVNTNERGDLYSINGEVSSALSLSTQPTIDPEQARQTALEAMAKWHQKTAQEFVATEPELWIYDESLLRPSTRPAELVWRMDVTSADNSLPVRELVLVNAQRGGISLHFNQIDTAWDKDPIFNSQERSPNLLSQSSDLIVSSTITTPYWDMVIDETRDLIYATGSTDEYHTPTFSRVDVIDLNTLTLLRSVDLGAEVNTRYLDLSPDKNLLAVTDYAGAQIFLVDLSSIENLSSTPLIIDVPVTACGPDTTPWDVVFLNNRTLYSTGYNDCVHKINLETYVVTAESPAFWGMTRLAVSPDHSYLYASGYGSGYGDKTVKFAIQPDGSLVQMQEASFGKVSFTISPDGNNLIDNYGEVYSTEDFTYVGSFARADPYVSRAIYIPSRNSIAALYGNYPYDFIDFVDATNLFTTSVFKFSYQLGDGGSAALAVTSTGSALFIASRTGLIRMDLSNSFPGTAVPLPGNTAYTKLVFDEPRNVMYGVDPTGHKIDVISGDTYEVISQQRFNNGSKPSSIAISPDGLELAVAFRGLKLIQFINLNTWETIATLRLANVDEAAYNDLVYGRPGRLYTTCSIVNTITHTEVAKLSQCFENEPYVAITQDNNTLYVNEHYWPQKMYRFDVSTDTASLISTTHHLSDYYGYRFLLLPNETKIYTDGKQIWSSDLNTLIATVADDHNGGGTTFIVYIPALDKVAFVINGGLDAPAGRNRIVFVDPNDNSTDHIFSFPYSGALGASVPSSDGDSLLVSTELFGLIKIDLTPFPPDPAIYGPTLVTYTNQAGAGGGHYTPIESSPILCINRDDECTFGADLDADSAHRYVYGTRWLYYQAHGRYNLDLQQPDEPIKSVVHYGFSTPNAFWDGRFLIYTDSFPQADDVVAHEFTHGVTQYESNLFYYYQSGAINEALSDLWGEYYDQNNELGNDEPNVKWQIGENISGLGAIRSMSNPPTFNHPDKMSSEYFYEGEDDNGGVHINSGVNNKAVYLMVDGGSFNGKTVTALGWEKTAAIYYEANSNLLISSSNYSDLYYALQQACTNLIGQKGITAGNCMEVRDALDAVEMKAPLAPVITAPVGSINDSTPMISGMAEAGSLINVWYFNRSGNPVQICLDVVVDSLGGWSCVPSTFLPEREIELKVNAIDQLNRTSPDTFHTFVIDLTAPTVISTRRENGSSTSANSVNFKVTFSEPVNDVNANDFTLSVSGSITGAAITNVTGSGSTRTVTVNTGSGNGTIRLDVPASASITDAAGNSLASLPFTSGESYTILKEATFSDVETDYWAWQYVERLYNARITGGCNTDPLEYCPGSTVTRAQMAIFLLKGIHGSSYAPPAVGGSTGFSDVQPTHWAAKWIKQLALEKITGGCAAGKYCPEGAVTRAQMAIFLLKARHGASYAPPAVGATTGFSDVPAEHWAAKWIKQLAAEGITGGCGNGNYCPDAAVTRAQMAVFLVKTFSLP